MGYGGQLMASQTNTRRSEYHGRKALERSGSLVRLKIRGQSGKGKHPGHATYRDQDERRRHRRVHRQN